VGYRESEKGKMELKLLGQQVYKRAFVERTPKYKVKKFKLKESSFLELRIGDHIILRDDGWFDGGNNFVRISEERVTWSWWGWKFANLGRFSSGKDLEGELWKSL